jgi:hypothetical protein
MTMMSVNHLTGLPFDILCSLWYDSPEGLVTATELIIGSNSPGIGPALNALIRPLYDNQFVGLADQVCTLFVKCPQLLSHEELASICCCIDGRVSIASSGTRIDGG